MTIEKCSELVNAISDIGQANPLSPPLGEVKAFAHFFDDNKNLNVSHLDKRDGICTRRELILRFLLLCAVLDQGPDIAGVRELLIKVVNCLYDNEIRIFHTPLDFFREMDVSVNDIWSNHQDITASRAEDWAQVNQSSAAKYSLFMDGAKQTLSYAIFRWGAPLALPYILAKKSEEAGRSTALVDYLESWGSAEEMSQQIKDDNIYGLGKAIGDKACHLFAKWMISTFALARKTDNEWGQYSYEVPFDSNAGRVLWRSGYFLHLANRDAYINRNAVQPGMGKGNHDYIRVTNIRGMPAEKNLSISDREVYREICVNHLKTHKRAPKKIEIQRLQHVFLMQSGKSVAAFDDGLIHIGREYCHNHDNPNCQQCPLRSRCRGFNEQPKLIKKYRT